jgi:hypothetical protein
LSVSRIARLSALLLARAISEAAPMTTSAMPTLQLP